MLVAAVLEIYVTRSNQTQQVSYHLNDRWSPRDALPFGHITLPYPAILSVCQFQLKVEGVTTR